jgi:cysteine desulfurase
LIYLDAAATAKYKTIDDIIVNTIVTAMKDSWMNPSSLYSVNVREKIDKCRANIAKFIGAKPDEIYFTSGASESNNWAIRGWSDANVNLAYFLNIVTTPIEHKSILEALNNKGLLARHSYCDIDKYGHVDCESLEELLSKHERGSTLVSIGMANNEIGTLQDIKKISELVHKYGDVLHVDATQAFGRIYVNVEELGIDMMSCSGHKISPVLRGVGFLYKKESVYIQPLIYGAQESEMRGGTENTYAILGLSKSLEYCDIDREIIEEMCDKRDYFIDSLYYRFGCKLNGDSWNRLPNNVNVTFPRNITGEALLYTLDLSGIKVSTGSACNSREIEPSHVLKAIGLNNNEAMRTVRFTLPDDITYEEIDYTLNEIDKAIRLIELNGD